MGMIDRFQRIAQTIQWLRLPSVTLGLGCLAAIVVIIFTSASHEEDRFLIPAFIGLLWAISTYSFVTTFRAVPEQAGKGMGFFRRLKRRLHRAWYWSIGLLFIATTLSIMFLSYRMVAIWFRDYAG